MVVGTEGSIEIPPLFWQPDRIVTQLGDTEAAHSPLWTERSLRRRLEVASAPFAETRAAALPGA